MPRFLCFVPLFRVYHPTIGDHFYTIDIDERNKALTAGYVDEGVACYVLDMNDPPSVKSEVTCKCKDGT